jgi:hypothetical protein
MAKEVRINVRTTERIKRELEIAAELRGMNVSSLVNSLAVRAIREEKAIAPEAFNKSADSLRDRSHAKVQDRTQEDQSDWRESLRKARGMWQDRDDLPDFDELRKEWSRDVWKEQE